MSGDKKDTIFGYTVDELLNLKNAGGDTANVGVEPIVDVEDNDDEDIYMKCSYCLKKCLFENMIYLKCHKLDKSHCMPPVFCSKICAKSIKHGDYLDEYCHDRGYEVSVGYHQLQCFGDCTIEKFFKLGKLSQ